MKTNTILSLMVAGAMSFTACTNKVDEKTIAEISQFGTEWNALSEKATAWSNDLSQTSTKAKEFAAQQTAMMNNMATSKDQAMKTKVTETATMANQDAAKFETMENEWNSFKTNWDENTKNFSEWNAKVVKGEISNENAMKGIADYRTKMTEAQAKLDSWGTQYAEAKSSCERTMAMAETMNTENTNKK